MKKKHFAAMFLASIGLGLLEAAWTTPSAPGATRAGLGCFAIGLVLVVACWPRIWWVPGLSMLQELTQIVVGQSRSVWPNPSDWFFHHWSAGYFGFNLYPAILFPLITVVGEIICLRMVKKTQNPKSSRPDVTTEKA